MRDQVGDRLFVRGPQGHLDLAVLPLDLELDQHVAEGVDPPALLEQADGREGRHEQFHRPGGVHPLADDLLGLLQGPQSQRQVGIGPGHDLVDQSGAEHEDMAGDFRPFGRFFHRGDERAGPEHGREGVRGLGKTRIVGQRAGGWQGQRASSRWQGSLRNRSWDFDQVILANGEYENYLEVARCQRRKLDRPGAIEHAWQERRRCARIWKTISYQGRTLPLPLGTSAN